MIEPIQTRYAGCFFRSRLEARWAVFFDALRLKWQYEPEGFVLPSGKHYLPDFCINLRRRVLWIDVKPTGIECPEISELMFADSPSDWAGITLNDIPDPRKAYEGHDVYFGGSSIDPDGTVHRGGFDTPYMFCICSECGEVGFEFSGYAERIGCCKAGPFWEENRITNAFAKARSARFEYEARESYAN